MQSFQLIKGRTPLFISMPHNGELIAPEIQNSMTPAGLAVADTDWYMDKLYDFAEHLGASIIKPKMSRYVIDLNRSPDGANLYPGANSTELCPTSSFDLEPLYLKNKQPDENEIQRRVKQYWQPYHQALVAHLTELKQQFGGAILLEAHSIRSHVPRFFEGQLPDFNFGTNDNQSCSSALTNIVANLNYAPYSKVVNGRFKGGYITRKYGDPTKHIHAIQLELSQRTYMHEPSSTMNEQAAVQVKEKLKMMVNALLDFAKQAGYQ